MVFNDEPLLDFIIPITVIIGLISIHGICTFLHDGLFLIYLHEWITFSFHLWFSTLISIHGIHTVLHDRLFLLCTMNGIQCLPIYGF